MANQFSDYVYYIQKEKVSRFSKGEYIINRVSKDGQLNSFNYDINKEFSKAERIACFVDEQGMYFILKSKNPHKKGEKKTANIQVYLMDHERNKFEIIKTDIKSLTAEEDEEVFVEFAGVDKKYIYLVQKWVSIKQNALKYVFYKLNKETYAVDEEKEFSVQIEDELVASVNIRNPEGAVVYNEDYRVESYSNGRTTYITYYANAGSFGCFKLDLENNNFYIYGLTSGKKFKMIESTNSKKDKKNKTELINDIGGGYVIKYDFNSGKESFRNEFSMQKNLTKDISKVAFYYRSIWFDILPNDKYRLALSSLNGGSGIKIMASSFGASIITCIVPESGKVDAKVAPIPAARNFSPNHHRFMTNTSLNKSFASKAALDFMAKNEKIRYPDYSVFGVLLSNKIILAKNTAYTKNAKLEFTSFDLIK